MSIQGTKMRISIARDFSKVPAGRYREDGPDSGERFREEVLVPALRGGGSVTVNLDGVEGYGSSFLEEAFGGLVRESGFTTEELKQRLTIDTVDPAWREEVWSYIENPGVRRAR